MILIDSTSIHSVGYDNGNNLYVKFKSDRFYTYRNVPRSVYLGLLGAMSSGKYFNQKVKGKYDVGPDAAASD